MSHINRKSPWRPGTFTHGKRLNVQFEHCISLDNGIVLKIIAHNVSVGAEIRLLHKPALGMELRYNTPPPSSNLDFIKASQDIVSDSCLLKYTS